MWIEDRYGKASCLFTALLVVCAFPKRILANAFAANETAAKVYPGDAGYPSIEQWRALNASISGRLLKFSNPGNVCYGSAFNQNECARFKIQYNNATFVAGSSGLTNWPQWAGNPCPPPPLNNSIKAGPAEGCGVGKYPNYIVKATSAEDVATAVKWAAKAGVRVVVKNTGHDFLGRNVGYGSLSIWTRHIQGAEWTEKWNGTVAGNDISGRWKGAAWTYGSGMTWGQMNYLSAQKKHIVVAGAEGTVGAGGGWLLGGGHGPYSNVYGLGVEQVLEFQVVTPDGEIRIASPNQNQDLFWALRGGGASTYGIVTRVSYKVYPVPTVTFLALYMTPKGNSNADQESWYNGMAFYLAMHPNFTDFGLSGYPSLTKDSYSGMLMVIDKSPKELLDWFTPIQKKLESYNITVEPNTISNEEFSGMESMEVGNNGPAEPSGLLFSMSSRLFSRESLTEANVPNIAKMLKVLLHEPGAYLLPYPNIPGRSYHNRSWNYGLNPAWKTAAMHMISIWHLQEGDDKGLGRIGEFKKRDTRSPMDKLKEMDTKMVEQHIPAMDGLAQNHGAYINEGSPFEKNWQTTFYGGGANYEKLLAVKKKYDPQNVLWCFPCVGGDVFKEGEDGKLYHA
ncbi:FAD-binding domain-containing protein [Tothia fuscella]|uniref:FAD-binding domain-containing protein n=1 Tax=Tothia fuscella TaxID=1048955 RepID=A0A9P4NM40_9PEZI|nr:FAD-binding domain-containing protein [Tothia fuscella]